MRKFKRRARRAGERRAKAQLTLMDVSLSVLASSSSFLTSASSSVPSSWSFFFLTILISLWIRSTAFFNSTICANDAWSVSIFSMLALVGMTRWVEMPSSVSAAATLEATPGLTGAMREERTPTEGQMLAFGAETEGAG